MKREEPKGSSSIEPDGKSNSRAYVNGIDGLRLIFMMPVVLSHIIRSLDQFGLDPYLIGVRSNGQPKTLAIGLYGVGIFFAMSGFLIPYLLGLEKRKMGSVHIGRFYMRRVLRIFPIYYLNIVFCLIIYSVFSIEFSNWDLMIYVVYLINIPYVFGGELPLLSHYWTLAVEEQFYVVWPWLHRFTNRQILRFCWVFLVVFLLVREVLFIYTPDVILLKLMDHVWFQCIIIGAIFSLCYLESPDRLLKIAKSIWVQMASLVILTLGLLSKLEEIISVDIELMTMASCFVLLYLNTEKPRVSFENRFFSHMGRLAYGIYIVHYPIIFLCGALIGWESIENIYLRHTLVVAVVLSTSVLVAHLIHKVVERPFLKLKERKFTFVHGIKS